MDDATKAFYEEGSEACRNYSRLTMRVRTGTMLVVVVASAAPLAAERSILDLTLLIVPGVLLLVTAFSLLLIDWHYQSAFTAIRNCLARIEWEHRNDWSIDAVELKGHEVGPWFAHLKVRTGFKDHLASYLPFVLLGSIACFGLALGLSSGLWIIPIVAQICLFAFACDGARKRHKGYVTAIVGGPADPEAES